MAEESKMDACKCLWTNKGGEKYFSTRKVFQLGNRETEMHNAREKIDEDENV